MLLTILLAAAQAALTPAAPAEFPAQMPPPGVAGKACPTITHQAEGGRATVRRLDQLPPGRLELTVLRGVGRCLEPVIVREGIGAAADSDGRETGQR